MVQLMLLLPPSFLVLLKSRMVLPFRYQFAQIVLIKKPLSVCLYVFWQGVWLTSTPVKTHVVRRKGVSETECSGGPEVETGSVGELATVRRDVQISGITEHATVSPEVEIETGCVTGVTELATVNPEVEIETGGVTGVTELATVSPEVEIETGGVTELATKSSS